MSRPYPTKVMFLKKKFSFAIWL